MNPGRDHGDKPSRNNSTRLREKTAGADGKEPTRVITVRLPRSLHESLKDEANSRKTSMNQLCISKLLQVIEEEEAAAAAESQTASRA